MVIHNLWWFKVIYDLRVRSFHEFKVNPSSEISGLNSGGDGFKVIIVFPLIFVKLGHHS